MWNFLDHTGPREDRNDEGKGLGEERPSRLCLDGPRETAGDRKHGRTSGARKRSGSRLDIRRGPEGWSQGWPYWHGRSEAHSSPPRHDGPRRELILSRHPQQKAGAPHTW